jgi:hypothetical protein
MSLCAVKVAGPLPASAVCFRDLLFGAVDLGGVDPGGLLALAVLRRPLRRSVPRFDAIHADTAAELPLVSSGMQVGLILRVYKKGAPEQRALLSR